jgi:hypothetical protein
MTDVSQYYNGDKKAFVTRNETTGFTITCYLNNKVFQTLNSTSLNAAQDLAEDFVMSEETGGPSLLNESN